MKLAISQHRNCAVVDNSTTCCSSRVVPANSPPHCVNTTRSALAGPRSVRCSRQSAAQPCRASQRDSPGASEGDQDDGDSAPAVLSDWREFRAHLISSSQSGQEGGWASRVSQENLKLLRLQNPRLAQEDIWAHGSSSPEKGGLLVASPAAPYLLRNTNFWQVVLLLLEHGPGGSTGLILNRPSGMRISDGIFPNFREHFQANLMFAGSRVYCGGLDVSQGEGLTMLHGAKHLTGAREVVPGIYTGGELAAAAEVAAGRMAPEEVRFFAGVLRWQPGYLQHQVDSGAWYPAASCRSLVLKPCIGLPVPLWREVLELMGGRFGTLARRADGAAE